MFSRNEKSILNARYYAQVSSLKAYILVSLFVYFYTQIQMDVLHNEKKNKKLRIIGEEEKTEEYFLRTAFSLQINFVLKLTVSVK